MLQRASIGIGNRLAGHHIIKHQTRRPLLACAIDIPLQWSLARRNHCLVNVVSVSCLRPRRVGVSPAWLLCLMRSSEFQRGTALYPTRCYPAANSCEAFVVDDDGNLSSQRSGTNNATCPSAPESCWNSCGHAGTRWGEAQAIQHYRAHPERNLAMSSSDRGDEQDMACPGNRPSPSRNKQENVDNRALAHQTLPRRV